MELSICYGGDLSIWNLESCKKVKFDSEVEEFILHMPFVFLAYPFSAYQIESGYLNSVQLNSGYFWKGAGFKNIFSEELIISNYVLNFVCIRKLILNFSI